LPGRGDDARQALPLNSIHGNRLPTAPTGPVPALLMAMLLPPSVFTEAAT